MTPTPLRSYPYLTAESPDSFARLTLTQRVPRFLDDLLQDPIWNEVQRQAITQIKSEVLDDAPIRRLPGRRLAPSWEEFFGRWAGQTWFEISFLEAEIYLYERLLTDLGYHHGQAPDPFFHQKNAPLTEHRDHLQAKWAAVQSWPEQLEPRAYLRQGMALALGGNQADLSQVQLASQPDGRQDLSQEQLLLDQRDAALDLIFASEKPKIHYLLDNAGLELMHDLMFIWLLRQAGARVIIHPKQAPIFVSDATLNDWQATLRFAQQHLPHLAAPFAQGTLFYFDSFWNEPLSCFDWPPALVDALARATLIIAKGDANYRRILGDRQLAPTADPQPLTAYLPAPLLALRTLKSEIQVGLSPATYQQAQAQDPHWMTSGKWGVYQVFP